MESGTEPARAVGLTFGDFLAKMKDPAAADLVRNIKSFIRTFEERPASQPADPEADSAAVQAFLAQSEAAFRQHPVWRGCQPEVLDQAVEGLEKYVMSKVWRQTFGACDEDRERDERYQRLMQALGFVDLPTLMGAEVQPDETLLGMAQAELLKMDRYKAPRDKLLCLVNVKTMVENIVGLAAKAGANIGGADAFFPVFLFVLIRSRLPRLASNVEYVKRFRMRSRLSGQFDYMLCNLESGAMYLDTVNYEHLAVSQEAFLRHLAAAGIPEAHLELGRMQKEAEQAAATGGAGAAEEGAGTDAGAAGGPAADYGTPDRQRQVAAQQAQQGGEMADLGGVLAGLELASGSATPTAPPADGELSGLGSAQHSIPATPVDAAAALFGGGTGSREGSLEGGRSTSLTPLPGKQSPTLLALGSGDGSAGAAPGDAGAAGETAEGEQQRQQGSGMMPRGLSFQSASELASVAEQQEQRRQQQGQAAEEQAAAVQAVAAAAAAAEQQHYAEAALIEEMVAEGTRHVLAAEAAGQLQQRYPFMYAQAEDLSLTDVQAVLVDYKELLLRYEALSRALQQQLGLGAGSPSASAAAGAAEAGPGARSGSVHRSKEQQRGHGFGSLIPPGLEGALLDARQQAGGAAAAAAEPDASPTSSGRWSPGGMLQRLASKTMPARSQTPPREDVRAAAAEEAAAAGKAGSPSKQSPHPMFSTLFGSSSPKRAKAQQGPAAPSVPPQEQPQQEQQAQQAVAASATSEPAPATTGSTESPAAKHPQFSQQLTAAAAGQEVDSSAARPEPSLDEQEPADENAALEEPAGSASLLDAGLAAAPHSEEPAAETGAPAAVLLPAAGGSLLDAPMQARQALQEAQPAASAEAQAGAGAWQQSEQPGPAGVGAEEGGSAQLGAPAASKDGCMMAVDDLLGLQLYGTGGGSVAAAEPAPAAGIAAEGRKLESEQPADHPAAAEPLSLL